MLEGRKDRRSQRAVSIQDKDSIRQIMYMYVRYGTVTVGKRVRAEELSREKVEGTMLEKNGSGWGEGTFLGEGKVPVKNVGKKY